MASKTEQTLIRMEEKLDHIHKDVEQNSKDIEVLLQFKNEYRRKEIFEQKILQFLINKLDKRRKRLMEKAMQDILKNIDFSNDYV